MYVRTNMNVIHYIENSIILGSDKEIEQETAARLKNALLGLLHSGG